MTMSPTLRSARSSSPMDSSAARARSAPAARSTCNERTRSSQRAAASKAVGPPCAMIVTMAYDEDLADRIRELIASEDGYTEQKMFGGIGFMIDGHMAVGVSGEGGLMIHCSKEETEALLAPSPVRTV